MKWLTFHPFFLDKEGKVAPFTRALRLRKVKIFTQDQSHRKCSRMDSISSPLVLAQPSLNPAHSQPWNKPAITAPLPVQEWFLCGTPAFLLPSFSKGSLQSTLSTKEARRGFFLISCEITINMEMKYVKSPQEILPGVHEPVREMQWSPRALSQKSHVHVKITYLVQVHPCCLKCLESLGLYINFYCKTPRTKNGIAQVQILHHQLSDHGLVT